MNRYVRRQLQRGFEPEKEPDPIIRNIKQKFEENLILYLSQQEDIYLSMREGNTARALAQFMEVEVEGQKWSLARDLWMPDWLQLCINAATLLEKPKKKCPPLGWMDYHNPSSVGFLLCAIEAARDEDSLSLIIKTLKKHYDVWITHVVPEKVNDIWFLKMVGRFSNKPKRKYVRKK